MSLVFCFSLFERKFSRAHYHAVFCIRPNKSLKTNHILFHFYFLIDCSCISMSIFWRLNRNLERHHLKLHKILTLCKWESFINLLIVKLNLKMAPSLPHVYIFHLLVSTLFKLLVCLQNTNNKCNLCSAVFLLSPN